MSTYLDKLIESIKVDIDREHERVDHITFRTRKSETQEVGTLKRLEQRLEVLEQLKDAEKNRSHITPSGTPEPWFQA
jgi:hypothetical protein